MEGEPANLVSPGKRPLKQFHYCMHAHSVLTFSKNRHGTEL